MLLITVTCLSRYTFQIPTIWKLNEIIENYFRLINFLIKYILHCIYIAHCVSCYFETYFFFFSSSLKNCSLMIRKIHCTNFVSQEGLKTFYVKNVMFTTLDNCNTLPSKIHPKTFFFLDPLKGKES